VLMLMISFYLLWVLFVSMFLHIPTHTSPYSAIPLYINVVNNG